LRVCDGGSMGLMEAKRLCLMSRRVVCRGVATMGVHGLVRVGFKISGSSWAQNSNRTGK